MLVKLERFDEDVVDVGCWCEILDVASNRNRCGEMQISGQSYGGIPTVADELDVVIVGVPGDASRFGQAAALGRVGLDNVKGSTLNPRQKRLPPR